MEFFFFFCLSLLSLIVKKSIRKRHDEIYVCVYMFIFFLYITPFTSLTNHTLSRNLFIYLTAFTGVLCDSVTL